MIPPELFARWERQRADARQRQDRDDVGDALARTQLELARSSVALEHSRRQLDRARACIDHVNHLRSPASKRSS